MLKGMMMNRPLLASDIIDFAAEAHPNAGLTSSMVEGGARRVTYAETLRRTAQLAHALKDLGVAPGDRIATLAWNTDRHFELYYGISGIGGVCHTINPRLFDDQLVYIIGHAKDRLLFFDITFAPLVAKLRDRLPADLRYVAMTDRPNMPTAEIPGLLCYEELLQGRPERIAWPELPEDAACALCYTSGTTGAPKGALYSNRSTVIHALSVVATMQDALRRGRKILPVVPLFHANAWGLPYSAPLAGASLVFPGPKLDGPTLFDLMESEEVFSSWGVPTVWLGLLDEMRRRGRAPKELGEVVIGGAAAPKSMIEAFERDFGVFVCHAWGMTEMSPVGTCGLLPPHLETEPFERRMTLKSMQGRRMFGVDLKIVDDEKRPLPHDGAAMGELYVRGHGVVTGYHENSEATEKALDDDGWFGTGDVASIDADGFLKISDRTKDLVKSGGEWISSIDLENVAASHADVANCAVIARPDPKWDERPILVVVLKDGCETTKEALLAHVAERVAKWQRPDDVVFVDALPLTATGKVSKKTLREMDAAGSLG